MKTFTRLEASETRALAASDSMRGVGASRERWPRDTQWRGWVASGHESAAWWPLFVVKYGQDYLTATFSAVSLRGSDDILGDDVAGFEIRTPWLDMKKFHA